jgi:flagellar assembly factor FliW
MHCWLSDVEYVRSGADRPPDNRGANMDVRTTRFGTVAVDEADVLSFPAGMPGLEACRHWVLLADTQNSSLGWLQSTTRPEIALAVVSPRRYVPDYQVRVSRRELAPLALDDHRLAKVLVIVGKNDRGITLNLKAPLIVNLPMRLGRQVVASGDNPVQHELRIEAAPLRKTA